MSEISKESQQGQLLHLRFGLHRQHPVHGGKFQSKTQQVISTLSSET